MPKLHKFSSIVAFFILIGGFFPYFVLVDMGMRPFLKGYFGYSVAIAAPFVAIQFFSKNRQASILSKFDLYFVLLLTLEFFILVVSKDAHMGGGVRETHFAALSAWLVYYFHVSSAPKESSFFSHVTKASFFLSSVIVLFYSRKYFVFTLGSAGVVRGGYDAITYQFFAIVYLANFALMFLTSSSRIMYISTFLGLCILVLIGSRTDFMVLLFASAIYTFSYFLRLRTLISLVFFVPIFYWFVSAALNSRLNRLAIFLHQGGGDNYYLRVSAFERALEVLSKHPIMGNLGDYPSGLYAHQIISVWVDFGLLGFASYVGCCLIFIVYSFRIRKMRNKLGTETGRMTFALLLSALAALLVTKSGTYYLVPVVFGLVSWHAKQVRVTVASDAS